MRADLNTALAKLRDDPNWPSNIAAFLEAIPEGAVLVAITRDDIFHTDPQGPYLGLPQSRRIAGEAWAALEAQT